MIGCILGGGTYLLEGDPYHSLAVAAGSVAIDIDHVYDFYREWGLKEGIRKLWGAALQKQKVSLKRVYLFFHGWDVLLLSFLICPLIFENPYWFSFLIGVAIHLFMDQVGNEFGGLSYVLSYRIWHRFRKSPLVEGWELANA